MNAPVSDRRSLLLGALGAVTAPAATQAAVQTVTDRLDAVLRAEKGFNGAARIEVGGRAALDKAYGWRDAAHTLPVDRSTLFQIASVTKLFTAISIMRLAQDGRLQPEDRIDRFFPDAPADKASITLAQLMTHTSGLGQDYAADGKGDRASAVRAIFGAPMSFKPGAGFRYTNEGFELLAAVVEVAAAAPWHEFVRRAVLHPAGMDQTRFWHEVEPGTGNVAAVVPGPLEQARGVNWGQIGSGGIWSNPRELARLVNALKGGRILAPASLKALTEPRTAASEDWVNYGWFTRKAAPTLHWMRGTEDFGHNAAVFWYPDQDIVMTLTSNAGDIEGRAITRVLAARLEPVLFAPA